MSGKKMWMRLWNVYRSNYKQLEIQMRGKKDEVEMKSWAHFPMSFG